MFHLPALARLTAAAAIAVALTGCGRSLTAPVTVPVDRAAAVGVRVPAQPVSARSSEADVTPDDPAASSEEPGLHGRSKYSVIIF